MRRTLLLAAAAGMMMVAAGHALDFAATRESTWIRYVGTPAPAHITENNLRGAMEWRVLQGPVPSLGATPYGIRLSQWDHSIRNFGLPAVAAEYIIFLRQLRADLEREKQSKSAHQK